MAKELYIWRVTCDGHDTVMVMTATEDEAGVVAARKWGVPWREVAAYLTVTRVSSVRKVRCSRCGTEFDAGRSEAAKLCPKCREARERAERETRERFRYTPRPRAGERRR